MRWVDADGNGGIDPEMPTQTFTPEPEPNPVEPPLLPLPSRALTQRVALLGTDDVISYPDFDLGALVTIDGGFGRGRVIAIVVDPMDVQYKIAWWNNGALTEQWIAGWRLAQVTP